MLGSLKPDLATTWSRASAAMRRTAGQSTWSSFPFRFITLPAIITVSTLPVSIPATTAVAGSLSGVTLMRSVRSMIRSACLPGVRLPTFASSPFALAPSIVLDHVIRGSDFPDSNGPDGGRTLERSPVVHAGERAAIDLDSGVRWEELAATPEGGM